MSPGKVNADKNNCFFAFLVCKNLYDFVETCEAIINDVKNEGKDVSEFPNDFTFNMAKQTLSGLYTDSMFNTDVDGQVKPNWSSVGKFPKDNSDTAYRLYSILKSNIVDSELTSGIVNAIKLRDKLYFINNFDSIFTNIPEFLAVYFSQCKNLIKSDVVPEDDQEVLWEFFSALMDMFINEQQFINQFKE